MPTNPHGLRPPFPQVLAERTLPAYFSSPAAARATVRHALPRDVDPESVATVALLISELVTNVVLHVRTPCHLRLAAPRAGVLRGEVHDHTDELPPDPGPPSATLEQGRGLVLVDALAAAWGITTENGGKTIWFDLDL